jgi:signal transduction histidine kinase
MVLHMPPYWDTVVDGFQTILCLLILLFLIRNRRKHKASVLEEDLRESGKSFNMQVLSQTIIQQLDQAFANIADTMAAERFKLESLLPFSRPSHEISPISGYPTSSLRTAGREISSVSDGMSQIDELHQQIQKLADKGMNARQISEELKTPLAEIELILSLNTGAAS